jgi:hypothetical protein
MHGYVARCPLVALARFLLVVVLAAGCTAEVSSAAPPDGGDRDQVRRHAPARGVVSLRLRDSTGTVAAQGFSDAVAGAPARTPFSGSLAFEPPADSELWVLEVFEASPVDGAVGYSVELPVRVGG